MKKVSKSNKTNTPIPKRTIIPHNEELQQFLYSHREKPVSDRYIEEFAKEMVDWALNDEDALKITQFYNLKLIHHSVVDDWRKRNAILAKAHALTLQIIGSRRERGALKGKLDAGMVKSSMAIYEREWREVEEWRAGLSKKEDNPIQAAEIIAAVARETLRDLTGE